MLNRAKNCVLLLCLLTAGACEAQKTPKYYYQFVEEDQTIALVPDTAAVYRASLPVINDAALKRTAISDFPSINCKQPHTEDWYSTYYLKDYSVEVADHLLLLSMKRVIPYAEQ